MVNLERAVTLNKPLGGHIVSGHIDGTGEIINIKKEGIATLLEVKTKETLLKYMVPKGSVALDGVSLTLVDIKEKKFYSIFNTSYKRRNHINEQKYRRYNKYRM